LLCLTDSQTGVGKRCEHGLLDTAGGLNGLLDLLGREAGLSLGLGFVEFRVDYQTRLGLPGAFPPTDLV